VIGNYLTSAVLFFTFKILALIATITVLTLIRTAPAAGLKEWPPLMEAQPHHTLLPTPDIEPFFYRWLLPNKIRFTISFGLLFIKTIPAVSAANSV